MDNVKLFWYLQMLQVSSDEGVKIVLCLSTNVRPVLICPPVKIYSETSCWNIGIYYQIPIIVNRGKKSEK
jgi:hypothetical protein